MGHSESNAILFTNMPSKALVHVYDTAGNLEEVRELLFINTYTPEHGVYYFNQNGRPVPTRDLIYTED